MGFVIPVPTLRRKVPTDPRKVTAPTIGLTSPGGMGLTGIIGEVTLRLIPIQSASMLVQHRAAPHLAAALLLS